MSNQYIKPLTIKSLLENDKYVIPIYQRNYDWGEKEALQLIEDIADYASFKNKNNYYIGSIVVFSRIKNGEENFETIDGQQRLTTLTILISLLRSFEETKASVEWFKSANLMYDHRNEADEAIRQLAENKLYDNPGAGSIVEVYMVMQKNLMNILSEKNLDPKDFVDYLLKKVVVMRIPVPKDTELNHYFEIMNSRGEQLEKHEVLKASLMSNLDKNCHMLFNELWEACADMDSFVQMKLKPKLRTLLFSESWSDLQNQTFDDLLSDYSNLTDWKTNQDESSEYISRSIKELLVDAENNIKYNLPDVNNSEDKGSDRFGSIINFPNFLLQTLKIMYQKDEEYNKEINDIIKLDDKRLIDIFSTVLKACNDKRSFVKRFIISLLKMRNLFDCYIIKRENYNSKEGWSIKTLKKYDGSQTNYIGTFSGNDNDDDVSKDIRMLEAMFHVSSPTQIYKHWLNAILLYLYNNSDTIKSKDFKSYFRNHLYKLACTYMLDRYLCEEKVEFEDIIYKNNCCAKNSHIIWEFIDNGCNVENFIFNFYDYLTWKTDPKKYSKFEFTYRTSVEHFYPQTPKLGNPILDKNTGLHDFGNLCLISRSMNSTFNNDLPLAKYSNFGNEIVLNELSLKLIEMIDVVKEKKVWSTSEINEFGIEARKKLCKGIVEDYKNLVH